MTVKCKHTKGKKRVPEDVKWCYDNLEQLTPRKFFEHLKYDNQSKGTIRYKRIIDKWITPEEKRNSLTQALKKWNKSEEAASFWRDRVMCDSETIVSSGCEINNLPNDEFPNDELPNTGMPQNRWIVNSQDVSKVFFDYRHYAIKMIKKKASFLIEKHIMEVLACFNLIFLIHGQYSNLQLKYFGGCLIDQICNKHIYLDTNFTMVNTVYSHLSKTIYDIQRNLISLEIGMIQLLQLSIKENISTYEKKIIKGVVSMLNFLPKKEVDESKLGESELWSTYHHPLLTSLLSDNQQNVILRWTNKAAENFKQRRPDAIICRTENGVDLTLAFGECKLGSARAKATCMDIAKLAMFTQRTINISNKQNVFSFNIKGFKVKFFVTSLKNERVYLMKQVGEVVLPRSLDGMPYFINMKTINDLLQVTKCYWEECNKELHDDKINWKTEVDYEKYLDAIDNRSNDYQ
ncbi:hypothetical protein RMATCC62417_03127 [Rhizopus microsporus]|nr:hypothetical protein RMATCC62417_03127 [Rhizopus microsporus]